MKALLGNLPFTNISKFSIEAEGGSAQLQFQLSTGAYVDLADYVYTSNTQVVMTPLRGFKYQWILTNAKVFTEA